MSGSACIRVLQQPELFERILLHLQLPDLLRSKDVPLLGWRDAWKANSKIQKALFLKPYHNCTVEYREIKYENNREDQEETYYHGGQLGSEGTNEVDYLWETSTGVEMSTNPIMNPFLNKFIYKDEDPDTNKTCNRFTVDTFLLGLDQDAPLEPSLTAWEEHENFLAEDAFWRPMLFTQPAMSRFRALCSKKEDYFGCDFSNGIKVDDMHAVLHGHLRLCPNCPKYFEEENRWTWWEEEDVDMVSLKLTGWQMLAQLKKRTVT